MSRSDDFVVERVKRSRTVHNATILANFSVHSREDADAGHFEKRRDELVEEKLVVVRESGDSQVRIQPRHQSVVHRQNAASSA